MKSPSIITVGFFAIFLATGSNSSTAATVANNEELLSSSSSSNYVPSFRSRFLYDNEDNIKGDDDSDTSDEVSVVMGCCLSFTDQHNTIYNNNNNSVSTCTEFYGDDVWNYDNMVEYCALKSNGTLTVDEECPSIQSLSLEFEVTVGWCYVQEVTEGNVTMIEATPMVALQTSNYSDNQKECESVLGGIFETISESTTASIYDSNSINATSINNNNNNEKGDIQVQVVPGEYDGCDESKCVSHGLWELFNNSFNCYFQQFVPQNDNNIDEAFGFLPMICADGYQPQIIENEATVYTDNVDDDRSDYPFYYFTCCPPNPSFDINTSRHCSNTTTLQDLNTTMICEDDKRPYPRRMKTNSLWEDEGQSYVCCDSLIDENQTNNFLNDIDCVPYQNKDYLPIYHSVYGSIFAVNCEDSEIGFQYLNDNYNCCKTKQTTTFFIQDAAFKKTVYPTIFLSVFAVIFSTTLIVALLIPLWIHLRVLHAATNVPCTANRATNRRLQQAAAASTYSSYNLYLVYLAIPDLILNLYLLGMYGSYANQKFNSDFSGIIIVSTDGRGDLIERAFILACSTANLYLNCVVSYEIFVLMRNSDQLTTYNPPSLIKVTLQAVGVYLFSIMVFIIFYFIERENPNANLAWSLVVTYVFPIGFFFYIWITIICRGYMPSVSETTKQLVWFFFRIVFIFCLIWLPGMCLLVIGSNYAGGNSYIPAGLLFVGIQPMFSTCMAMTKADVKKYVIELITLSYIPTKHSQPE